MIAAIDIGSNSVRLMLCRGDAVTPKSVCTTSLADGLALSGRINENAAIRTRAAVARFVAEARESGAEKIYVFGTEAMRSASNGGDFALSVFRMTGIMPEIVSGETEARLGLMGALDPRRPKREICVVDVGGASVEIVRGSAREISYARSLPLGMVRLIDIAGPDRTAVERYVASRIREYGEVGFRGDLVGIGGTATSLAAIDLGLTAYDPFAVHGHFLSLAAMRKLIDRIFASPDRVRDFPCIGEKRARVIGHGAIVLAAVTEYIGADGLTVSERDNLEGYILLKENENK